MTVVIHGTQGIDTPDLDITGSGARIEADFSSLPHANRVSFQTSTVNAGTTVQAVPNGTSLDSSFVAFNQSTPVNCAFAQMLINNAACTLASGTIGSGTLLPIAFNTGGAERMRIATNGDVGIGNNPSVGPVLGKFHVNGSIIARAAGGGEGGEIALLNPDNASVGMLLDVANSTTQRIHSVGNNSTLQIGQFGGTGGNIAFISEGTERMRMNAAGRLAATGFNAVTLGAPNGNNGFHFDIDTGMFSSADGILNFYANNILRMQIDQGGSVRINKDNPSSFSNSHLELKSTVGDVKLSLHAEGTSAMMFKHVRGGTGVLVRTGSDDGYEQISASAFNVNSDYRLKENVLPMQGALGRVMQLQPCTYTWKADGSYGEGFIAHQLQEVVPIAVTGKKDAMLESGEPDYQGVDPGKIVALLTAALQELKHEVDSLRMEVKLLKGAR